MPNTDRVVSKYRSQGHPLTRSLKLDDVSALAGNLATRFGVSKDVLDFSPLSLKRLEQLLVDYHEHLAQYERELSDEETLQLVREIGSYWGAVIVQHADGKWFPERGLNLTYVQIDGPVQIKKGSKSWKSPFPLAFLLGNIAATAWDAASVGHSPRLYDGYLKAKRKNVKGI